MTDRLLVLLSSILDSDERRPGSSSGVMPLLRFLVTLLAIVLTACSKNAVFVTGIAAFALLRAAMLPIASLKRVMKRLLLPVCFSLLILLPAALYGHPKTMLSVAEKVFVCVLVLAILNENLSWKEITGIFAALHLPDVFTMTLDMTVRFLVILSRLCQRIHEAYLLRAVSVRGNDRARMRAAGGILGTVFLMSNRMSGETAEAMTCRCFDGTYRKLSGHRLCGRDFLYLCLVPVLIVFFIYTQAAI